MMKMKGRAALAAAVLATILNAGTLQAADEASSLEGDSVSYDMATGEITAEGGITLKSGTTTITGARASYNTKTQQGEITGGVVAVHDAMRLTAQTVTLESAAAIHATGGAEITKDDLRLTAEKLSVFDQDRYVAEGNVRAVKADKTFTGARAEFTQSTNYLRHVLCQSHGRLARGRALPWRGQRACRESAAQLRGRRRYGRLLRQGRRWQGEVRPRRQRLGVSGK